MTTAVRNMPSELASITEAKFHFTDDQERDGVQILYESPCHELWELLAKRSEVLVHPYNKNLGTIEDLGRQLASACEDEIKLHASYCDKANQIAYIEEKNAEGHKEHLLKDMTISDLMRSSVPIFSNWEAACMRVKKLEELCMAYRNDRTNRLNKALAICRKIPTNVDAVGNDQWTPDTNFIRAIEAQIKQMQAGLKMTPYYKVQNCVSHLTKRPLFAPSELSPNLGMTMKTDPYWRSTITGDVKERADLLTVVYDHR